MNLNQLYYFLSVIDLKHMTKAAELYGVSQSTISMSIKSLETELGVSLIEHIGRNIETTKFGLIFSEYVRECISLLECGIKEVKYLYEFSKNILSFSTTSLLGVNIMPTLLSLFNYEYPDIKIKITQGTNKDVINSVANGVANLGLGWYNPQNSDCNITQYPIFHEEIFIIINRNHRLANEKTIDIEWLDGESIIVFSESTGFRQSIINVCRKNGFEPNILHEAVDNNTVATLVENEYGLAFVGRMQGINREKVTIIPISNNELYATICILWNDNKMKSESMINFEEFIKALFPRPEFRKWQY